MSFQSYIICGTPRSGSTLLCGMLANARCGRPDSYFGRPWLLDFARDLGVSNDGDVDGLDFNRRYLDAVLTDGRRGGSNIFGLRLMFDTVEDLSARLDPLFPGLDNAPQRFERAFGRPLYIYLSREDKVAQAVSLYKASRTGLWHRAADGSEMERTAPHQDADYDADKIGATVAELSAQDRGWHDWFAAHAIAPLQLKYEDLSRDPRSNLRKVLTALGRDASLADHSTPATARLADEESARWVARFREESAGQ
jgi:LPS sulfotransferase NodH